MRIRFKNMQLVFDQKHLLKERGGLGYSVTEEYSDHVSLPAHISKRYIFFSMLVETARIV